MARDMRWPIPRDLKEPDGWRDSSFRKMLLRERSEGWLQEDGRRGEEESVPSCFTGEGCGASTRCFNPWFMGCCRGRTHCCYS